MTGAPAGIRRRGLAAAGVNPLRRPPAARGRSHLFVIATLAVLAACCTALAGYLVSRSPAPAGNVFTTRQQVSLQQVRSAISSLYGSHPDIASFTVQDVSYTASSRDTVLRECTSGGPAAGSQNAETRQVIACAPLIFFFYSYGTQASVPAAVTVAGELYWYAVTHITGPASARTSLDEVLGSWKLPVPALTPAQAKSALVASVITAATDSMLGQKGVHVVITSRFAKPAAAPMRIVADLGTSAGAESISSGAATATIRVTPKAAYFTGNPAGLTSFLGLPASAAAKARSRWVAVTAGTTQYQALASENVLSSLPGNILPSTSDTVRMRTTSLPGTGKVYVMDWTAQASGSATTISAELVLTDASRVLPVSETLTADGETKVVTLSRWGSPVTVPVPGSAVAYPALKG